MKLKNKRVLVTGVCGFIGSHIATELVKRDCEVIGIDNLVNGKLSNIEHIRDKIKFYKADIADPGIWKKYPIGEINLIYHEAALNLIRSVKSPVEDLTTNAGGTLNILNFMRNRCPDAILINASSGSIYGEPEFQPQTEEHPKNPASPYGISKLCSEQYVSWFAKQYGLKAISLRYYNVVGPRQNYDDEGGVCPIFIRNVLLNKPVRIEGTGKQMRCFTSVHDVVRANILAYENWTKEINGKAYNIGVIERTTIKSLADKCIALKSDYRTKIVYAPQRIGDIDEFSPDISKAKTDLGYEPQYKLSDTLPEIYQWLKKELC